jgi:hypothetical protein
MIENEKLIDFMIKNKLSVNDVAAMTKRKRKTVLAWRSNRIPPTWVLPLISAKLKVRKFG